MSAILTFQGLSKVSEYLQKKKNTTHPNMQLCCAVATGHTGTELLPDEDLESLSHRLVFVFGLQEEARSRESRSHPLSTWEAKRTSHSVSGIALFHGYQAHPGSYGR